VYGPHVPPSNWSLWINNLIYLSKKYPIRRVIGVNSLDIPEIPNEISVENFLKELDK
jgi:hypothetical protein